VPNKAWSGWVRSGLFQLFGESKNGFSPRPPLKQTLGQAHQFALKEKWLAQSNQSDAAIALL
jgi:hypothetical protein